MDMRHNPATGEIVNLTALNVQWQREADPWFRTELLKRIRAVATWPTADRRQKEDPSDRTVFGDHA